MNQLDFSENLQLFVEIDSEGERKLSSRPSEFFVEDTYIDI